MHIAIRVCFAVSMSFTVGVQLFYLSRAIINKIKENKIPIAEIVVVKNDTPIAEIVVKM